MEVAVARLFGTRKHIIVPRVSWGFHIHECDILIIRKSGYAIEVELKRSIADLKKDLKKKHQHKDSRIRELYFGLPQELLEKGMPLVPARAGLISIYYRYGEYRASFIRSAQINSAARKLTTIEQLMVARLGTLRIWNLKEKLL